MLFQITWCKHGINLLGNSKIHNVLKINAPWIIVAAKITIIYRGFPEKAWSWRRLYSSTEFLFLRCLFCCFLLVLSKILYERIFFLTLSILFWLCLNVQLVSSHRPAVWDMFSGQNNFKLCTIKLYRSQ